MRRFLQRMFLVLIVVLAVAGGAWWWRGDQLAAAMTRRAIDRITAAAAVRGLEVRELHFARASFAGLSAMRWEEVRGVAQMKLTEVWGDRPDAMAFTAAQVVVDVGWPWRGQARVRVIDGRLGPLDAEGQPIGDQLTRIQLDVEMPVPSWRPTAVAALLEQELTQLMRDGSTRLPLVLGAVADITVGGHPHAITIRSAPEGNGGARILLDADDIRRISATYSRQLTEAEIEVVVRNPHRAPALLRFSEIATRSALALQRRDRTFPADAYRHVYWSWMITRAFGPTFSEEVTDAHEIGATYETGAASRRMDLHNNAVGRAYALAAVPESELIDRVRHDPNVRREPAQGGS